MYFSVSAAISFANEKRKLAWQTKLMW